MKPIKFTQFLMPNGRQVPAIIDRPDSIADKAAELITAGCRLEIEMLSTGKISMAVERGDDTLAIDIVPNGPQVPAAIDKMICEVHQQLVNNL